MGSQNRTILMPVFGMRFSGAIKGELSVGRVLFISPSRLGLVRRRLGIPRRISELIEQQVLPKDFNAAPAYAVIRDCGDPTEKSNDGNVARVQESLWVMAASQFGHMDRGGMRLSLRPPAPPGKAVKLFWVDSDDADRYGWIRWNDSVRDLELDEYWQQGCKESEFFRLLAVIGGHTPIREAWRSSIHRAAVLAGRSQMAPHIQEAFLLDMIAIETLLARKGDKYRKVLEDRIFALFGWVTHGTREHWRQSIERLYDLRCDLVHEGAGDQITAGDLLDADMLLANLLTNLVRMTDRIQKKEDLVEFARRIDAREVLGLPLRDGTEPLTYMRRHNSNSRDWWV